jgi:photosystem II stability/assembly factor-like uncharacterized protein
VSDPDVSRFGLSRFGALAQALLDNPPVAPTPVEQLQRRVRRRRQRHGALMAALVVVLAGVTLWIVSPFGTASRSVETGNVPTTVAPPTTAAGPPATVTPVITDAAPVGELRLLSPTAGYAVNGIGLYVTDDAGAQWRDVKPPDTYDPVGHMTAVAVLDANHLLSSWSLNSFPYTNFRSTDGGRTWTPNVRCGTDQCPPFTAFSFYDARHGWALVGGGTVTGTLYTTADGGASWTTVGPTPFDGELVFRDGQHGWGRTGPNGLGPGGSLVHPGGALYRTADGGRTWTAVDPLGIGPEPSAPALTTAPRARSAVYGVPALFGSDVVVPAWVQGPTPGATVDVLVSHDDGATWSGRSAPDDLNASRYTGDIGFPFSASSVTDWVVYIGPRLYSTRDGGATWTTVEPEPTWQTIEAVDFVSAARGWAEVINQGCTTPPVDRCTLPTLVSTDDGGRTWSILDPH